MLFDVAKHWLMERGMEAMDGPINFGERDTWWGLVIEGFKPPIYRMNYNPPYYNELFETYGFKIFLTKSAGTLLWIHISAKNFLSRSKKYNALPEFSVKHIRKNNLEKFASDFCIVYNKAWASHEGNKQMSKEVALKMFKV